MAVCEYRWDGKWGPAAVGSARVDVVHMCTRDAVHLGRHSCHCGLLSSSGVVARVPDAEKGIICDWQPEAGSLPPEACPQCGHLTMAHYGNAECPVCVLVWHGTRTWLAQEARKRGLRWPV